MVLPEDLIEFVAWVVAAAIVFNAWRRYRDRDAMIALIGFLVVFGSALVRQATLLTLRDAGASGAIRAYTIGVIATYLAGMAGGLLIAYAFRLIVRSRGSSWPFEQGDQS
ncbi:MAG: hypothetical protein IIB33_06310 [Chloroflexi bacterium]|nr:hypothetical protein [Chloroflexota bacterium]